MRKRERVRVCVCVCVCVRERERYERDYVIRRVKLLDMMGLGKQSFTKTDTSE